MVLRLKSQGLKEFNHDLTLGRRTVVMGPPGSGKSQIADAIRFAGLGFIPRLGKTEDKTAAVMSDRVLSSELTFLADGRSIRRAQLATDRGGFTQEASASWLADQSAGATRAGEEIQALFGVDEQAAIEALSIDELVKAPVNRRQATVEALIQAGIDPDEIAFDVMEWTVCRLARVPEDQVVEDYRMLALPKEEGGAGAVPQEQVSVLFDSIDPIKSKLKDSGIAGLTEWANERKCAATKEHKEMEAARKELARRLTTLPEQNNDRLGQLEAERDQVQQSLGAIRERNATLTNRRKPLDDARAVFDHATAALDAAKQSRGAFEEAPQADLRTKRARLDEITQQLTAMTLPATLDDAEAASHESIAEQEEQRAAAIEIATLPTTTEVDEEIRILEAELKVITDSPYTKILERVDAIDRYLEKGASKRPNMVTDVREETDAIRAIVALHVGSEPEVRQQLDAARARRVMIKQEIAQKTIIHSEAIEERDRILTAAKSARKRAQELRSQCSATHRAAVDAYSNRKQALEKEAAQLRPAIAALETRDRHTAELVTEADTKLQAADRNLANLLKIGDVSGEPESTADRDEELSRVDAEISQLRSSATLRAELAAAVEKIQKASTEKVVFTALENACIHVRAERVEKDGGPFARHMLGFLRAAGRSEVPYLRAEKNVCEFGWRTAKGKPVPVQALSDGQYQIFAAALAAAYLIVRNPPVKLLLVEAGYTYLEEFAQLLAGIDAVIDQLTAVIVFVQFPVKVPAGWDLIDRGADPAVIAARTGAAAQAA